MSLRRFFLLLVAVAALSACSDSAPTDLAPDDVPPPVETGSSEQRSSTTTNSPASAPTGTASVEGFDVRIDIEDVSAEWVNEYGIVLTGVATVDNLDLGRNLQVVVGWIWTCRGDKLTNQVAQDALRYVAAAESYPESGWDTRFTSPLDLEPLTAAVLPLPTLSVPTDDGGIGGSGCDNLEMTLLLDPHGDVWAPFSERSPEPEGLRVIGSELGFIPIPIDIDGILRSIGVFESSGGLALADLCDALAAQDLEALFGTSVSALSLEPDSSGVECTIGETGITVLNSETVSSDFEGWYRTNATMEAVEGSSTIFVGTTKYGVSVGYVKTGDTTVVFADPELDQSKMSTLGRLIERVSAGLLSDS